MFLICTRARDNKEEVEKELGHVGRCHHRNLGVAPYVKRIGVMPGMTPSPIIGFVKRHEPVDPVEHVIEPSDPEGCAVTQLMGLMIRHRVHHAVEEKERNGPPGAPGQHRTDTRANQQNTPDAEVNCGLPVRALHQGFHLLSRNGCREPLVFDLVLELIVLERAKVVGVTDERVTFRNRRRHCTLP